jgi:signal transduction histidine kinase
MSLRIRLFLVLGALVAALVLAHGWLVRSLAGELTAELDVVALDVGEAVARALSPGEPTCADPPCPEVEHHVRVLHLDEKGKALADGGPKKTERVIVRKIVRGDIKAGKGYSYYYTSKKGEPLPEGATPGEIQHEQLIIKLGDPAQGALHLQAPGLAAEVPIPRIGLQEKLAEFERKILLGSAVLLLAGLLAAAYLAHRVSAPLLRLSQAAVAVGGGDLGATVDERAGSSEVRDALGAFNRMSSRLRELSQQNRRLLQERHLGEIGEIARGLAHSLRNPLHALGLSVDEIAAGSATGEQGPLAAAARRQIGKLDRNIRSFLVFASQGDALPQPVELGALAEDVALEALQDRHTGVRVEIEKGPGELTLPAVEQELRAIVQALLVNAIEASPPGETVLLRVGQGEHPGRLRVAIEDRGDGLAPEVRERLFTPHVTTKASGSGMGLFLAQRLAAGRYDGSLELQDRDGGGTRAILELGPRAAPGAEP